MGIIDSGEMQYSNSCQKQKNVIGASRQLRMASPIYWDIAILYMMTEVIVHGKQVMFRLIKNILG